MKFITKKVNTKDTSGIYCNTSYAVYNVHCKMYTV